MLVLDSGGVSRLARRRPDAAAVIAAFKAEGLWPPVVPSVVLVESTTGRQRRDANINRFLKTCDIVEDLPQHLARRAGTPADVAAAVRFLADAPFVTGAVLPVDGGRHLSGRAPE